MPEDSKTEYAILTLIPKGKQFVVDASLQHLTKNSRCERVVLKHTIPPFFVYAEDAAAAEDKARKIILPIDLDYESVELTVKVYPTREKHEQAKDGE